MATASRDALDEDRMEEEEEDEGEGEQDGGSQDGTTEETVPQSAPRYPVPARRLAAVEVPAVVQNVDRAIRAFGRTPVLSHVGPCIMSQYTCYNAVDFSTRKGTDDQNTGSRS
jgi:hypothetical protein